MAIRLQLHLNDLNFRLLSFLFAKSTIWTQNLDGLACDVIGKSTISSSRAI